MSVNNSNILALDAWLTTPAGQYVLNWEQAWMDKTVPDIFGYHAVQIGMPLLSGLRECRIPYKSLMIRNECAASLIQHQLVGHYEELPFASHSLDLLVLPHVLEFTRDPHQVLREADRVLIPEGRLIVTGFNPLSLWGIRKSLFGRRWPIWPESCHTIALSRLKDWLNVLSFEMELGRFGCYRMPSRRQSRLERMGFMEKAGDRWWPICGAVYMITAVKRVRGVRLIGPSWKLQRSRVRALGASAQKTAH